MRKPVIAVVVSLACALAVGAGTAVSSNATEAADEPAPSAASRAIVVADDDGDVLATVPLTADTFAVSYRNSIYHTLAEERYDVRPDEKYELVEIAADQLAVLEEYYAVPSAPVRADPGDRRNWVVPPDPDNRPVFEKLSIAATDLGERTVHVPGEPPLKLWRLTSNKSPFLTLDIKEIP